MDLGQQICRGEKAQGITKGQEQMNITQVEDCYRRLNPQECPNSDFFLIFEHTQISEGGLTITSEPTFYQIEAAFTI